MNTSKQAEKAQQLKQVKDTDDANLTKGVAATDELTKSEADKKARRQNADINEAFVKAKICAIRGLGVLVIAFFFLMLVAFSVLLYKYVQHISDDPEKVSGFLHESLEWVMVVLAALFVDRKISGDK